ncbi:hypothetical protein PPYR_02815 [Photinus pyralis]|uniref:Methyltransferase type 12 domain-containing protein n=1 Tax=Photinus pyralis TaxID=7054 RepID=A0A1Y1LFD4_PHOPY|nr:hypothetical protein PPYR_02815 [Photinus pyralis]
MNNVVRYINHSSPAQREARYIIGRFAELVQWKNNCRALDVGCGPGNVTHDVLLPILPKSAELVVGIDKLQSAIEHANKTYGGIPKLIFRQVNMVSDTNFTETHEGYFDHAFSFSCLHFIKEQEVALGKVWKMLKPGGDFSFTSVVRNRLFVIISRLAEKEKWRPYIGDYDKYMSPYQYVTDPEEVLREILQKVGFEVSYLKMEAREMRFPLAYFAGHIISHVQTSIPSDLQEEFGRSALDVIREINLSYLDDNGEEMCNYDFYNIFGHVKRL